MTASEPGLPDRTETSSGDSSLTRNAYGDSSTKRNSDPVIYQRFEFLHAGYSFGSVTVYSDAAAAVSELCYREGIDNLSVEFFGDGVDSRLLRSMPRSESVK